MKFAERAIEKQPLDYLKVVASDTLRTFRWTREGTNDTASSSAGNLEGSGSKFRFESAAEESVIEETPGWVTKDPANAHAARDFGGANYGELRVVQPWSDLLRAYQKVFYLRGPFVFLFVLVGAVGVWLGIRRRTRVPGTGWGGLGLLPWLVGRRADRASPDDGGIQLPLRAGRRPAGLPGGRPRLLRPRLADHLAARPQRGEERAKERACDPRGRCLALGFGLSLCST